MTNESTFSIVFRTRSELDGAIQVQHQLERQIGAAKALGEDYAALDKKLITIRESLAKYGEAGEQSAGQLKEAMERFVPERETNPLYMSHEHLRHIGTALRQLGPLGEEAGHLLHFAFNPWLLALTAAGTGLAAVIKHTKDLREELKALQEMKLDLSGIKGPSTGVKEAMEAGKKAAEDLARSFDDITLHQKTLAEAYSETTAEIKRQQDAHEAVIKGQVDVGEAQIAFLKEHGQLTEEEATRKSFELKILAERNTLLRANQAEEQAIARTKGEVGKEAPAALDLSKQAQESVTTQEALKAELATVEANVATRKKQLDDAGKKLQEAEDAGQKRFGGAWQLGSSDIQAIIEKFSHIHGFGKMVEGGGRMLTEQDVKDLVEAQGHVQFLKGQEQSVAAARHADLDLQAKLKKALDEQSTKTKELTKQSDEAAKALADLNKQLESLIKLHTENAAGRSGQFRTFFEQEFFKDFSKAGSLTPPGAGQPGANPLTTQKARGVVQQFDNLLDGLAVLVNGLGRAKLKTDNLVRSIDQTADQVRTMRIPGN